MKSFTLVLFLALVGITLGAQPSVWSNRTCPKAGSYDAYIIQGEEAPDGNYPYMLSLNFAFGKSHACGASILTDQWALTAAHCCEVMDSYELILYSGSNKLSEGGKYHEIDTYVVHPDYQPRLNWRNDVCLIKVKDPFVFGPRVEQITLPPQGWPVNDGDLVEVTGWGYTDPFNQEVPDDLQLGKNFVALSSDKCKTMSDQDHESYLCVMGGKNGQGVCNGDSGSPLTKDGVQVGIASWVFLPCGCNTPDFYARVPLFVDWIKEELGSDAEKLRFLKNGNRRYELVMASLPSRVHTFTSSYLRVHDAIAAKEK